MRMKKPAILLLAHGTPESVEQMPDYLARITGGRPVPDAVIEEVKHRFAHVGGSPLTEITMRQAKALEVEVGIPVYVGMRNWRPFIADAIKKMAADGVTDCVAICLAPQNSQTSVGLYKKATFIEEAKAINIDFVESWHDHPLLAKAFAEKLQLAYDQCDRGRGRVPVIFTAHSVPCRTIQAGDPYGVQARESATQVAKLVGLDDSNWFFAFQSQGMSGGPWIGPTVEETITGLRELGHLAVIVQPIGFVCDHVEVLYDIDVGFRDFAKERGMTLSRPASLNASPTFIACLAEIAKSRMAKVAA
jgi:protoporphyrin/coproporphyrin ferrochelatase